MCFFSHMNAIGIAYDDLSPAALLKIFKLADLLSVPPAKATQIYLQSRTAALPVERTPMDRTPSEGLGPEASDDLPV